MTLLDGLHPGLIEKITSVLAAMKTAGHPMRVCQGVRSAEVQAALFATGRTLPGVIVTNCDGIIKKSRHQIAKDGFGHAVDCCFLGTDPFGIKQPWALFGAEVEKAGLRWGGKFSSPVDLDHAELL